ncbi:response regulator [Marinomonas posidonica]|uniref:response regulator n=1 Tax=Marinomonas posidonica TaxID=936476 RepID=UPI003736ED27
MSLRVLLVDDSKVSRLALTKSLRKIDESLQISEVNSADAAEVHLANESVDLMLIDFNMPERNGLELAEVVSAQYPHIKQTLVTANIQDAIRDRATAMGLAFIGKPVKPEELANIIGG